MKLLTISSILILTLTTSTVLGKKEFKFLNPTFPADVNSMSFGVAPSEVRPVCSKRFQLNYKKDFAFCVTGDEDHFDLFFQGGALTSIRWNVGTAEYSSCVEDMQRFSGIRTTEQNKETWTYTYPNGGTVECSRNIKNCSDSFCNYQVKYSRG